MKKLITLTMAVLMVGLFAAVVYAATGAGDDSSSTVGTTETSPTTETTETTTTPDNRNQRHRGHRHHHHHHQAQDTRPDDSPQGADDVAAPASVPAPASAPAPAQSTAPQSGVDTSGPCDEAEHANDPRCNGGQAGAQGEVEQNDDNGDHEGSGSGRVDDHSGSAHDGQDDNSGDDSGHGGGSDG